MGTVIQVRQDQCAALCLTEKKSRQVGQGEGNMQIGSTVILWYLPSSGVRFGSPQRSGDVPGRFQIRFRRPGPKCSVGRKLLENAGFKDNSTKLEMEKLCPSMAAQGQ